MRKYRTTSFKQVMKENGIKTNRTEGVSKMSEQVKPCPGYVYAKRVGKETMTKGGLFIPDEIQDKKNTAIVEVIGKDKLVFKETYLPCPVSIGDKIFFDTWDELNKGDDYIFVKFEDIIAVL